MSYQVDSYGNAYFPAGVSVASIPATTGTQNKVLVPGPDGKISSASISQLITQSGGNLVSSIFGRTGAITALRGDYNTDQVTEGQALYFTTDRARKTISLTTFNTSGPATYDSTTGILNIPQYGSGIVGNYVPVARTITINGQTADLSANRTFTIDAMVYPSVGIPVSNGTAWGNSIVNNSTNWNTAFGWGNHALAGYLTSFTETDPTVPSHVKAITTTNISNWNTAYTWGNHALAGYLTSFIETDPIWTSEKINYYTKTQADSRYLQSYTETDPVWTSEKINYYTKTQADGRYLQSFTETDPIWTSEKADYALKTYVDTSISNLVDAAPTTLNTLNELAAALGDDANFSTSITTLIGTKEPAIIAGTTTQYWRGDKTWQTLPIYTLSGLGGVPTSRTLTINGTSYDLSADRSWSITSMIYPSAGIAVSTGTAWGTSITDNSTNWNTAYGWGNHASAGYLTTATAASTYASLSGAYSNPAFVASLAWSKITGAPAFLTSYTETDPIYTASSWYGTTNNASNWNTAFSDRFKWDGGSSGLNASTGRTSLGLGTAATANTGDFAAASHTHSIANVSGLQTALDGKEPTITAGTTSQYWRGDKTWQTLPVYTLAGLGGQPQLNGTGFVKASGTTISYDNSTYYLASNPSGYITSSASITGTAQYFANNYIGQADANTIWRAGSYTFFNGTNVPGGDFGLISFPTWSSTDSNSRYNIQLGANIGGNLRYRSTNINGAASWSTMLSDANYNSYSPTLTGGGASGTWGINITGNAATVGGYSVSASVGANTVVIRDVNNYIYAHYINSNVSETENPTINSFYTSNGDGWLRKSSLAHVRNQLGNYGGWITGYTETDTLASVTARGASTSTALTISGVIISTSGSYGYVRPAASNGSLLLGDDSGLATRGIVVNNNGGAVISTAASGQVILDTQISGTSVLRVNGNQTVTILGNTVWHAGNDGSGSSLDADTVDGIHIDGIVWGNARGTNDSVTTDNNALDKTGYYTSSAFANRPSGVANWMYIEHIKLYNNNSLYQKQIGYDTYDDRMWVRTENSGTWSSWKQIWTSDSLTNLNQLSNGPGYITGESDTLTSVTSRGASTSNPITINGGGSQPLSLTTSSGSPWHLALVRTDLGLTSRVFAHNSPYNGWYFEHNISIAGNTNIHSGNYTSYSPSLTGAGASGTWGININGTATNLNAADSTQIKFNSVINTDYSTMTFMSRAWSAVQGTNGLAYNFTTHTNAGNGGYTALQIYYGEGGYVFAPTSFRAPIFYDSNDTNYYVDPNATSRLNNLQLNATYSPSYTGQLILGSNSYNFNFLNGSWAGSITAGILANCSDQWEFAIHDSGHRVVSPFLFDGGGNHRLLMGRDIGWGQMYIEAASSFRAPIFYDSQDTTYYLDPNTGGVSLNIAGSVNAAGSFASNGWSSSSGNEAVRVYAPKGGSASWDGGITGAIRIKLPQRANNTMWSMKVRIYNYSTNQVSEYTMGNYSYDQGGYNASAHFIGANNAPVYNVRFGNQDGVDCVWIGETSTSWSYPVVSVISFEGGFRSGNAATWDDNWNITYVTSFGTVATSIYPSLKVGNLSADGGLYATGNLYLGGQSSYYLYNSASGVRSNNNLLADGDIYLGTRGTWLSTYLNQNVRTDSSPSFSALTISGTTTLNSQVNINRHIDANTTWGSCTSIFVGWGGGKVILGNSASGGHDYALNLGCNTVVSTNPFFCYQDITAYSDARVKDNIQIVDNAIEKIKAIRGVTYTRSDNVDKVKRHAGVLAQEVLEVLPEVVNGSEDTVYSVAYGNMAALFIEAIKEQQTQIEELKKEIKELKNK
jgi:hypothetical protein